MDAMKTTLQDALDELVSSCSSMESKSNALSTLERLLALACIPAEKPDELYTFLALQDTFECNVPSRLLPWIAFSTSKLELLTNKGSMDDERGAEASTLSSQLCLSLSIMQGVVLHHGASKRHLGRRYALEVLVELLRASRHLSSMPNATSSGSGIPLSSVVLDTVLCILVDSSPALRAFEESNGVQAVVKILKRAGTPREVRMKCLEFLYFYLLDETSSASSMTIAQEPTPPPTAPATPLRRTDSRSQALAPRGPTSSYSRYGSDFSLSSISSTSSFSTSTTSSFSSTSSNDSSSTNVTHQSTPPGSTDSTSPTAITPPRTPPLQSRPFLMLRKEVDFVPQSPKKPQLVAPSPTKPTFPYMPKSPKQQELPRTPKKVLGAGVGGRGKSLPRSRLGSGEDENRGVWAAQEDGDREMPDGGKIEDAPRRMGYEGESAGEKGKTRTTDEKRRILGSMFGNVDALVEGVRKAGVWGLG